MEGVVVCGGVAKGSFENSDRIGFRSGESDFGRGSRGTRFVVVRVFVLRLPPQSRFAGRGLEREKVAWSGIQNTLEYRDLETEKTHVAWRSVE